MQNRLSSALSVLGREALRIVLPSWCVACSEELPWRDRAASCCGSCWSALPRITVAKCSSCGQPAPSAEVQSFTCIGCQTDPLPLEWCEAWGEYRGALEKVLQAFKFGRHDFLDGRLAGLLEEVVRARGDLSFDAVVAVPMARGHERRRGYNQAALLAAAVGERIGVGHDRALLRRDVEGVTQSTLPKWERAANVRGAFSASAAARDRAILLVDDICTTGETLRACATALRKEGAAKVCAAVVAKAV